MRFDAATRRRILAFEATRWVGIREAGGPNRGQVVELFQKAVDGRAVGEPWCMAFAQFCIGQTDKLCGFVAPGDGLPSALFRSESVLQTWNQSPFVLRREKPLEGYLMLWWAFGDDGKPTGTGHVEVVLGVRGDGQVNTAGGNTTDGTGVSREGDGVYLRSRDPAVKTGRLRVLGYLDPWPG